MRAILAARELTADEDAPGVRELSDLLARALVVLVKLQNKQAANLAPPLALDRMPARPAEPEKAYITRREAAAITGYSSRTIDRYIDQGLLRASGPHLDRIKRFEIDRFMEDTAAKRGPAPGDPAPSEDDEIDAEVSRLIDGGK